MQTSSEKKERVVIGRSLIDLVFSWSVNDVLNNRIYENQVKKIPRTFSSTTEYLKTFTDPLVEETRADLSLSMTTLSHSLACEVNSIKLSKDYRLPKNLFCNIVLKPSKIMGNNVKPYEPESGDLIVITSVRPRHVNDLERSYALAYVQRVKEDRSSLSVLLSKPIPFDDDMYNNKKRISLFAIYLINMTTNIRIWTALISDPKEHNTKLIEKVLQTKFLSEEKCIKGCNDLHSIVETKIQSSDLNESQQNAVLSCIRLRECRHQSRVKPIWGPPGTGKTKRVGFLLNSLLRMNCRTLTCAPTNTAVLEVTERLVKLVVESSQYDTYGLGDIVLFGNGERMKMDERDELYDVFLDHRIDVLDSCFASQTGWRESLLSMISLLEDPLKQYYVYLQAGDKEKVSGAADKANIMKDQEKGIEKSRKELRRQLILHVAKEIKNQKIVKDEKKENDMNNCDLDLSFREFLKKRFVSIAQRLYFYIVSLYTHLPTSLISPQVVKTMLEAKESLKSFQKSLARIASDEEIKQEFGTRVQSEEDDLLRECRALRMKTLFLLKLLPTSFPVPFSANTFVDRKEIVEFFLANARLIFCTVSSSAKLNKGMIPFEYLVIDEAAQLKECESAIPLQLPGIRYAVLIGDERQLPAMVKSKVCEEADFGRSLFERLSSLGHKKHLLNVQHRMHPAISLFPNREFYENKISDGQNVRLSSYNTRFLQGKMFGPYSFINVAHGNEVVDNKFSTKNMVEVAVVSELIAKIYNEVKLTKKRVRLGVISPYKAQVHAICERLKQYSSDPQDNFSVSVRSVDGFQGGEEDIIIISTVQSNGNGSVGFLSNRQRVNVALTRARHCLWIVGNGETLGRSRSVWKNLVNDAKRRQCFHNADEDKNLARAIIASLVKLNQIRYTPNLVSSLFREAKWKLCFDDDFWSSMARVRDNNEFCKEVFSLLDKLSLGWRRPQKERDLIVNIAKSSEFAEYYKVKQMYLVWAVDTLIENSYHLQVLKVWSVVEVSEIARLSKQVDKVYGSYALDKKSHCKYKHLDKDLVVPMKWPTASDPIRLSKSLASLSLRTEPETTTSSTSNTFRDLVVPMRSPAAFSPITLSKSLASLSPRTEPEETPPPSPSSSSNTFKQY